MKYKIGIFGSATGASEETLKKAEKVGKELSKKNCIIITGATSGVSHRASTSAYKHGAEIWGFSPVKDLAGQRELAPGQDESIYKKFIYVPEDFSFINNTAVCRKYRNVTSTAICDAGIIISGRWGTLNEFTNLYDMGKVIGVLTKTGGIADELKNLCQKIKKESKAKVIFSDSPKELVDKIISELIA